MVLCAVSVLGPLGTYVREQSNTASLQRQVAAAAEEKERLARAVQRWDDPAFVTAQARDRLHYVLPGETGYVVLELPVEAERADALAAGDAGPARRSELDDQEEPPGDDAWYGRLWGSVETAGQR